MGNMQMAPENTATGATVGGAFSLTDQTGRHVTDKHFTGHYRLIYFGFTSCPDVCPVHMQKMTEALKMLDDRQASKITPIFITIDPERDTPPTLKAYLSNFSPHFVGLTGTLKQVQEVENGYKVYAAKVQGGSATDYMMNHSAYIYLMGPSGEFIDILDPDLKASDIAARLKKLK